MSTYPRLSASGGIQRREMIASEAVRSRGRPCADRRRARRPPGPGTAGRRSGRSRAAGPGLERVGVDHHPLARSPAAAAATVILVARFTSPVRSGTDMHPSRPFSCAAGLDDLGVDQHDQTVPGPRLRMGGDVDTERLRRHPDLRSRQPDAAGRHPHRRHQVGAELDHRRIGRIDGATRCATAPGSGRGPPRSTRPSGSVGQPETHSSSFSTRRNAVSTPSSRGHRRPGAPAASSTSAAGGRSTSASST